MLPATVESASREYMDDEDTLLCFLQEQCQLGEDEWTETAYLHHRFSEWMHRQGVKPWGQRTLTKAFKERGFEATKRGAKAGVKGLKLTDAML